MNTMTILRLFFVVCAFVGTATAQPYFQSGQDPKPDGREWVKVDELSDEFDGDSLDLAKWHSKPDENGWKWIGRSPAIFSPDAVSLTKGEMRVAVSKLVKPVVRGKSTFTHQGAIVRSRATGRVGMYYECKMKANQTVMSSTFWLSSLPGPKGRLELDIQECVGRTTEGTQKWAKHWDQIFHSNVFHWPGKENPEKSQQQAQTIPETKNWEQFYVYAAWWKSPKEIRFYLNGKYTHSIKPKFASDAPAYITMAIEAYDWNPLPEDGGLVESGTLEQRTTRYEWVRTWKLE